MPGLYALIKWIAGEDEGKYSAGVPTDWVKNFDYKECLCSSADNDEPYVIEWRDSKKPPEGGWKCSDGIIIQVSDCLAALEKTLNLIEGHKSPKKIVQTDNLLKKGSQNHIQEKNKEIQKRVQISGKLQSTASTSFDHATNHFTDNYEKSQTEQTEHSIVSDEDVSFNHNQLKSSNKQCSDDEKSFNDSEDSRKKLKNSFNISGIREFNTNENSSPNDPIDNAMVWENRKRIIILERQIEKFQKMINDPPQKTLGEDSGKQVQIFPGSGVKVTVDQWPLANTKPTFTSMGISLMTALYPMSVLLCSNFKGGAAKTKGANNLEHTRKALDPKILNAIKDSVKAKFPTTYSRSGLGIAINNKLNKLRMEYGNKPLG